jgi:hypothetical protein
MMERVRWLPAILLRQRQAEEIAKTCSSPSLCCASRLYFELANPEMQATSREMRESKLKVVLLREPSARGD